MSHLVLAIAFNSGIFQHLSGLLLKHKDYQPFASLVLPAGSPGARCRPASGRGPYPFTHSTTHPPTHSFTHLPIHPPSTKPILLLSSVWFSRPAAARAGRVGLPARGKGPVLPRGLRGREAGDTPGVWRRLSRARPSRHLRASLSHVTVASSLLPVARARARRLDSRARSTGPSPREEKRRRERARRPGGAGVSGGCRGRLFTKARVAVA